MSTAIDSRVHMPSPARHGRRSSPFAGIGQLLRFIMRRDRIWAPAWVLGNTMLMVYVGNAVGTVLDDATLQGLAAFSSSPALVLIGGPGYGFDQITIGRFIVGMYGTTLMIIAGLMGIFTVSRHTRVEEQTGRAELLRSGVIGRHTLLIATMIHILFMNAVATVLMAVALYTSTAKPGPFSSCLLFACSISAVGIVFAGVAAVTVQLSTFSKASSSIAGALLALSFALRGLGDMSETQHGDFGWLSWLSPMGWSLYTAPLTFDRWWPLLLAVVTTVALVVAGFALQSRRDLGAGIIHTKLGAPSAPSWFGSPLALAWRLQKTSLIWWTFTMAAVGAMLGFFLKPMADNAKSFPDALLAIFGGVDGMVNGYLGFMAIYSAIIIAIYSVHSVQALWAEESAGRTAPILATAVSRSRWFGSWLVVPVLGTLWLLVVTGASMGFGAAITMKDWSLMGEVTLSHLAHTPTALVLMGLAALLYGIAPRLIGVTWAVLGYSAFVSFFGEMLKLDDAVLNTSVFRHIGQYPAQDISWLAVGILTVLALVLFVLGAQLFARRDLKG